MTSPPLIQYYSIDNDLLENRLFLASIPDNFGFTHGRFIVGNHQKDLARIKRAHTDWETRCVAEMLLTRRVNAFAREAPHIHPIKLSLHPAEEAIYYAERHLRDRADNVENWHVPSTVEFQRDPDTLAELLTPILYDAPEIVVIDPQFRVERGPETSAKEGERFVVPFKKILARWREINDGKGEFTIYTERSSALLDEWLKIPGNTPEGVRVFPIRLKAGKKKKLYHNRFVLSSRGGVFLGWGMDAAGAADQFDMAARIDEEHANTLKQRFKLARKAKREVDPAGARGHQPGTTGGSTAVGPRIGDWRG